MLIICWSKKPYRLHWIINCVWFHIQFFFTFELVLIKNIQPWNKANALFFWYVLRIMTFHHLKNQEEKKYGNGIQIEYCWISWFIICELKFETTISLGMVRVTAVWFWWWSLISILIFEMILEDQKYGKCKITESMHKSPLEEILSHVQERSLTILLHFHLGHQISYLCVSKHVHCRQQYRWCK